MARVQTQAAACWKKLEAEVMRHSLAEGACVEAFVQAGRAAIQHGVQIRHPMRVHVAGDAPLLVVDTTTVLPGVYASASAVPSAPAIESGDLAQPSLAATVQGLLRVLTPRQVAQLATALYEAAGSCSAEDAATAAVRSAARLQALSAPIVMPDHDPYDPSSMGGGQETAGAIGAAVGTPADVPLPLPALPLPAFLQCLIRVASGTAAGGLHPLWKGAAVAAASGCEQPMEGIEQGAVPPTLLSDLAYSYAAAVPPVTATASESKGEDDGETADRGEAPLVDWRRFLLHCCVAGQGRAPELEQGPEHAAALFHQPPDAVPAPESTLAVSTLAGVQGLTASALAELYADFAARRILPPRAPMDAFGSTSLAEGPYASLLVPAAELVPLRWWFERAQELHEGVQAAAVQTAHGLAGQPEAVDAATTESKDGWHHVHAPHVSSAGAHAEVRAAMAASAHAHRVRTLAGTAYESATPLLRAVEQGEGLVKGTLLHTFSVPAGCAVGAQSSLVSVGLHASSPLVDLGALCNALLPLAAQDA